MDILKQGLNTLENNIQMFNSGTLLDKPENRPIETFQEAITELKFFTKEALLETGGNIHGNISHQVVFDLLTEIA